MLFDMTPLRRQDISRLLTISRAPHPLVYFILVLIAGTTRTDFVTDVSPDILRTLECRDMVGLSVAVVRDNETLLAHGYGMADIVNDVPMTADTPIAIGSLTKAFTVELLAQLLFEDQEHGYSWDTPLRTLLADKDFQLSTPRLTRDVTLRDLLAHRVGIRATFLPLKVGFLPGTTREDLVRIIGRMCPQAQFREKFIYNNYMYVLAGYAAEVLAGDIIWEELIRQRIFGPLGMHNSGFVDSDPQPDGLAKPYGWNGTWVEVDLKTLFVVYLAGPAGSIASSARDMAAWMKYVVERTLQIHPAPIVEIFQPQMVSRGRPHYTPDIPVAYTGDAYGLGWKVSTYRGYRDIHHSGGISTFSSRLAVLPEARVAVFLSTNGPNPHQHTHRGLEVLMMHLTDLAMGLDPQLAGEDLCTYPMPWFGSEPRERMTPAEFKAMVAGQEFQDGDVDLGLFEGTYVHPEFGTIHIVMNTSDDHLHFQWGRLGQAKLYQLQSRDGKGTVAFQYLWEGYYAYDNLDGDVIVFNKTNSDGVVPALGIRMDSSPDYFVRDSLFHEHQWTCPGAEDMCKNIGHHARLRSTLSWAVALAQVVFTYARRT